MKKQDFALKYESGEFDNENMKTKNQSQEDSTTKRKLTDLEARSPDTSKSDDEILEEAYNYYTGCDTKTAIKKAIALTREACEKEPVIRNIADKIEYKAGFTMGKEAGQKAERERILEMLTKGKDKHGYPMKNYIDTIEELKKEVLKDDRT